MLESISQMTRETADYTGISTLDNKVIEALRSVDRVQFVPDSKPSFTTGLTLSLSVSY